MNSQTTAQPLASKSKSNARRNKDAWFLSRHGLVSEGKVIELTKLEPERLKGIRQDRPHRYIRIRGEWFYSMDDLVELLEIANCLRRGKP